MWNRAYGALIERAYGDINNGVFCKKEKWVLFRTVDEDYGAVGHKWANTEAGNYLFIADQTGFRPTTDLNDRYRFSE